MGGTQSTQKPPSQQWDHDSGSLPEQPAHVPVLQTQPQPQPQPQRRFRRRGRCSIIADQYHTVEQVVEALAQVGLESSNLIVGVDFTKSNEWTGKLSFHGRSLHHISDTPNPYEHAISIIGQTLANFDDDNLIPCYGFGDASTHDRDVFSFYPDDRPCNGFPEALRRYRELVPHVRLAGPTSFAPIVEMAMTTVEKSGGQYHVLLIIADGQVTRSVDTDDGRVSPQEQMTVDAIVKASELPLSIVLVGVGDGPWDMMKEFDDNIPARSFDNFQFVNFTEIMLKNFPQRRKEAEFALRALMEIPLQYKATLDLGILGRQSGRSPNRVALPPPGGTFNTAYTPAPQNAYTPAPEFSKPTASPYPTYESVKASVSAQISKPSAPEEPSSDAQQFVCPYGLVNPKDMAFGCGHQVVEALAQGGLESSNLIVGVDFTKSNEWTGKYSFHGRSLHHISDTPNPYEHAISIIGQTLSNFDDDNLIPCYGFGDASTHDRDVFSFYPDDRPCNGFPEALRRYRELVPHVRLAGPTSFAPIVEMAMTTVEKSGGQYHVLLIIADGQVTRSVDADAGRLSPQEQMTVDAIVKASKLPLSIVLVGVGDGPWDMKEFNDNIPARSFDNFQFVNFTEIMSKNLPQQRKEAEFARTALMEIPLQYKATLVLGILGRQSGRSPNRVALPPPSVTSTTAYPAAPEFSKSTASPWPAYDSFKTSASASFSKPTAPEEPCWDAQQFVCPICLVNPKDMAFGCGHQTCVECSENLLLCPICRSPIQTRIKLY